jgi:predicted DsbA family dithiol-disulfide isomerase
VCPWCFIGRRRLGAALALLAERAPDAIPRVSWHPFQLNPDLPPEGVDRQAYLRAKFGAPADVERTRDRVCGVGAAVGIDFAFDLIRVQPNTLDAHRLISWAQMRGSAEDVVERIFRAFFLEGRNVGDRVVLAAIAAESGFDRGEAAAMLASERGMDEVAAIDERVRALGVTAVPFFVFGEKIAVSGAQEPGPLVEAMLLALADAPA